MKTAAAFIPASSAPLVSSRTGSSFTPGVSTLGTHTDNEVSAHPLQPASSDVAGPASVPTTAVASNEFFKSVAESIRRKQVEAARKAPKPRAPTDFHTMTDVCDFLPPFRATVVAVSALTKHKDYFQITVDVSDIPELADAHTAPGESMHLSRMPSHSAKRHPGAVQAVIASPPNTGPLLDFLVSRAADPAKLTALKPGDAVAVGPVSGPALSVTAHLEKRANLLFFADSPQAFAAVRSLVEWDVFRAMSGSGANRTSSVTVFYALPSHQSIPYSDRFSKWSVFGVNIVPIAPAPLLDYLTERNSLGGSLGAYDAQTANTAVAIVAARSNAEYEKFFMHLIRLGVHRTAVVRLSADDMAAGGRNTTRTMPAASVSRAATAAPSPSAPRPSVSSSASKHHHTGAPAAHNGVQQPHAMPDAVFEEMRRMHLEREIWAEWVKLREELRKELQNELSERRRIERNSHRADEAERVAWQGWTMRNNEHWGNDVWDNEAWQTYWQSWGKPRDEEATHSGPGFGHGPKAWNSGGFDGAHRGHRQWNQQDSDEYWDWVGRGAGKSGSASGAGAAGSKSYSSYSDQYSGYGSWGNENNKNQWSGYQKSGYKYEYEETDEHRKQHQKQGYGAGAGTGPGGDWWSGWNKQNQNSNRNQWYSRSGASGAGQGGSRSRAGAGGGGRYGQRSRQGDNLDLYGILGISSSANRAEIKKAYRKKAMDHHPDRNPDRKDEAHVIMKQIVTAWTVLKDESRRSTYDRTGVAGV